MKSEKFVVNTFAKNVDVHKYPMKYSRLEKSEEKFQPSVIPLFFNSVNLHIPELQMVASDNQISITNNQQFASHYCFYHRINMNQ